MIFLLDADNPNASFPDPAQAETEPNGLLALGGDLSPTRLIAAYSIGVFPWFSAAQPILWWSPDPRMVLYPPELKVSRSLRKTLRRGRFDVSIDQAFDRVIQACAEPRRNANGTWLLSDMIAAYQSLHTCGVAHSFETWRDGELVGGLYGVALGRVFFGESMFSREADASKVALVELVDHLCEHGFCLIDCQMYSDHLARLGAKTIPRADFQGILARAIREHGCTHWAKLRKSTQDMRRLGQASC
jgi:leucyl/phenylalanyl-tRNA--protein transferase